MTSGAAKASHADHHSKNDRQRGDVGDDHGRALDKKSVHQPQQKRYGNEPKGR